MGEYSRFRQLFKAENMPLCYLDLDLLDKNIQTIIKQMEGTDKTIRIASKSLRIPWIIDYLLKQPNISGILSYSGSEALFLAENGFDDIIIAYPIVNVVYIESILNLSKNIYFMVDSTEQVDVIDSIAEKLGKTALVCIDIDLSNRYPGVYFGVYRSPVKTLNDVEQLGNYIKLKPNVQLSALMGYEAQIAGVPDSSPARNFLLNGVIRILKKRSRRSVAQFREQAIEILRAQGHELNVINGGGTGSVNSTKLESMVTEVTVGSGFFSPVLFDYYNDFKYKPAMGFAIEVTRHPQKNYYTCHGGGYIASGSVGIDKQPKIYLPAEAKLIADEGCGEVQTPIKYTGKLQLGDPVLFRHAKAGELTEHFNEVLIIQNDKIVNRVPTYRGLGNTFL